MSTAISLNGSENIKNQLKLVGLSGELEGGEKGEKIVSTLPYDFYLGSAVVYNGEIHILGSNSFDSMTSHYKWNGSSWNEASTLPYQFVAGSAVVLGDEIHILGSIATGGQTSHYKWNGSSWTSVSTLPYLFSHGSAVVFNNEIHILGGSDGYTNHYKWNGSSWSSVSTLPYNFYYGSAVVYNGEIHIFGGNEGNTKHYKWNSLSWSELSTLPFAFFDGICVVFDNCIYIGSARIDTARDLYKWDGEEWSYALSPYNLYKSSAVIYNNAIHLLGGGANSTTYTKHESVTFVGWTAVHEDPEDPTSDITGYTQDAAVQGITANDILFVSLDNSQMSVDDVKETEKAMVRCVSQSLDTLSFAATKCPQCDISLNIVKQGGGAS